MKHFTTLTTIRRIVIVFTLFFLLGCQTSTNKDIALDPKVKHGVLENGLSYYILKNQEPKNRASFYLVQNVGAILEEDNQNGLAHFLEHMALNGTQHFKGKTMLNYLESYGVNFGRNINAYTGTNETVYNISNVPTTHINLLDSTLLILHDWCNYLSLDSMEIEAERGVIHEEWRTRRTGKQRLFLESRKYLYENSKYEQRDVIGDTMVIDHFDHKLLHNFYHDWYRTDLQAIIIVGDFNEDSMEKKVKELFSQIPANSQKKERYFPEIPTNEVPIVGIITDKEASNIRFEINIKHITSITQEKGMPYFKDKLLHTLYSTMLNDRLSELVQKGSPPYISAISSIYSRQPNLDIYNLSASLNNARIQQGIEALFTENERVLRYGFTKTEFERAKALVYSKQKKIFKERLTQNNDKLATKFKENYLVNEPFCGIEQEFELVKQILLKANLNDVNKIAVDYNTKNNCVFILSGTEKDDILYPTEEEILTIAKKIDDKEIAPYVDDIVDKPLITNDIINGKLISEEQLPHFDATMLTLSNGARVIIKPSIFKDDEILYQAFSTGGYSNFNSKELASAAFIPKFIDKYGLGMHNAISLKKHLTGLDLKLSPILGKTSEGFKGYSCIEDIETLLQLQYLMFEYPRFDKGAFDALKNRYLAYTANLGRNPNKIFNDSINIITNNYSNRTIILDQKLVSEINFDTMKKCYLDRFQDASDFVFILVGNINAKEITPLIEKYIGGITSDNRIDSWVNTNEIFPNHDIQKSLKVAMKTPKTSVYINKNGNIKYTEKNRILIYLIKQLLEKKYTEIIREKEGGTYGVKVRTTINHFPIEQFCFKFMFDTDPAKEAKLRNIVYSEFNKLSKNIDKTDIDEAKEYLIKTKQEKVLKNEYWLSAIVHFFEHNEQLMDFKTYETTVNDISNKEIVYFMKHINLNTIEIVMNPN